MPFEREIGRILFGLLVGLLVVVGSAAYWAVAGPESLLLREDNPRRVEFERAIRRGAIYDASEMLLAHSVVDRGRFPVRMYLAPAFFGTLGYYSFRYGTGGVEAFYDGLLSGRDEPDTWERWWREQVLGLPRVGTDVRLTLRWELQDVASEAVGGRRGVVIALNAEQGDILALVSRPTYDPNELDEQWAVLSQSPENPFFNRALQGRYQPGSALHLPMVLLAALGNVDLSMPIPQADAPQTVNGVMINCAIAPPTPELTLADALSHGCPAGVVRLTTILDASAIGQTLVSFELEAIPPVDVGRVLVPEATPAGERSALMLDDVLGQGRLTLNPLAFARFLAAVVSEGAVPPLRLADAVRPPQAGWQVLPRPRQEISFVTRAAATQGRDWLLATGSLLGLPNGMGGYAAVAQSGEETQVWFAGFVSKGDDQIVVLVILENTADVREATAVGSAVLQAYVEANSTP
ncbi:MAG: penicillin-binding transpeptidase domain-containing protein [Anaerolinea sp.]